MDSISKERLRLVIAVAIGLVPRRVKKAYADRFDPAGDEASRHISEAAAEAVAQAYDVTPKPVRNVGAGALYRPAPKPGSGVG
jgi:hypothetical protein